MSTGTRKMPPFDAGMESRNNSANPGRSLYLESTWEAIREALLMSQRELEIAQAVFDDLSEGEIAESLGISVHTVHTYLKRLYQKLGAGSRVELVCILVGCEMRLRRTGRISHREFEDRDSHG